MAQQSNPLDQLRGIHFPEEAVYWELAPGWWVLISLMVLGSAFWFYRWLKKRQKLALLKPSNKELQAIAKLEVNSESIATLSELIKRICLLYYPRKKVASLSGSQWIDFLNQESGESVFDDTSRQIFAESVYQAQPEVDQLDWQKLVSQSEKMIDFIIRNKTRMG